MHSRALSLIILIGLSHPWFARAQGPAAAVSKIKQLNHKAMNEYDSLEFEEAKNLLLQALEVAQKAKVQQKKVLVQTYLNLGIVFGAGLNDRINAIKYFTEALQQDHAATLSPTRATPMLEEIFSSAKESLPPPTKPKSVVATGFSHIPIDEARQGRPIKIKVKVGADIEADHVALYFKGSAASTYQKRPLKQPQPGIFVGQIPGALVIGRSIYYYLEAQDKDGKRLVGHGSDVSPNIIVIKMSADRGPGSTRPEKPAAPRKRMSIGLMAGAGVGLVYKGESEHDQTWLSENSFRPVPLKSGLSLAPFHVAPEISYHISDEWHISILGRIQLLNIISLPRSDISLLAEARAKRFFGEGDLRWFFAFGGGAGEIRHRITLEQYDVDPNTPTDTVDSRVAKIVAFGAGGGLRYMFSASFGWAAELNLLILVPQFAANLDLNTGLVICF